MCLICSMELVERVGDYFGVSGRDVQGYEGYCYFRFLDVINYMRFCGWNLEVRLYIQLY